MPKLLKAPPTVYENYISSILTDESDIFNTFKGD